jgi:hypothetical protein
MLACDKCNNAHQTETEAGYMTSNYNFQEDIERARPPDFQPTKCIKCGKQIKLNSEVSSRSVEGTRCQRCAGDMARGIPKENIYCADGTQITM